MLKVQKKFVESCFLVLLLMSVFFLVSLSANAQGLAATQAAQEDALSKNTSAEPKSSQPAAPAPVYKEFMGVTLGMSASDIRTKLGHLKDKGGRQDFFVFSDSQTAQIVYDEQGKATIISVDYINKDDGTPTPEEVLGEPVQAKPDGSIFQIKRYPEAGYWVAYSRTAGDNPTVTVTMQKI